VITPEEMMERYRQGIVKLDDAADYFYKRLYPRRYRLLKRVPQYLALTRYRFNKSTRMTLVREFPSFAAGWVLQPLFALHYRKTSDRLADMLRANRQPCP
jgi:hypothetical protein